MSGFADRSNIVTALHAGQNRSGSSALPDSVRGTSSQSHALVSRSPTSTASCWYSPPTGLAIATSGSRYGQGRSEQTEDAAILLNLFCEYFLRMAWRELLVVNTNTGRDLNSHKSLNPDVTWGRNTFKAKAGLNLATAWIHASLKTSDAKNSKVVCKVCGRARARTCTLLKATNQPASLQNHSLP